jgi:replication factor A1
MVNINELKVGMNNINLKATVADLAEPREVMTKFGTVTQLVEATLEDGTGSIKLTLWGKQSEGIEKGKEVEVTNGFTKQFREELQLGIGRGGSVKVVE